MSEKSCLLKSNTAKCNDGCIFPSSDTKSSSIFTCISLDYTSTDLICLSPIKINDIHTDVPLTCSTTFKDDIGHGIQTQIADGCIFPSVLNPQFKMTHVIPSYNLFSKSNKGKSMNSYESRLTKTLNRTIRSIQRLLGIDKPLRSLETDTLLDNLQTLVTFTRRVQKAVKDLKTG